MSLVTRPAPWGPRPNRTRVSGYRLATFICSYLSILCPPAFGADNAKTVGPEIRVRFGPELSKTPLDGRLLVMLSTDPKDEPRNQISDSTKTQQIFGIDVDGFQPDQEAKIDGMALGYPVESPRQVPPGKYRIQALLHRYETFHRADGHVVKLPMDRGEGQQWNKMPGNPAARPPRSRSRRIRVVEHQFGCGSIK